MPPIIRWFDAHDCSIKEYGKCSAVHLDRIHISDSYTCNNTNCSIRQHINYIDNLFDDICLESDVKYNPIKSLYTVSIWSSNNVAFT